MALSVIETHSHYTGSLFHNSRIVNVTGDIYAIVGRNSAIEGILSTVTIPQDGDLAVSPNIDTFTFATVTGANYIDNPHIMKIADGIFAIVYTVRNDGAFLITVDIDSSGNIGAVLDTLEFFDNASTFGGNPHICAVSGDIYAIVYSDSTDSHKGKLVTVDIDSAGNIANAVVDSHEFDSSQGRFPHILPISGTVYAIAYRGANNDGWIKTLTIADDGIIAANPVIDALEFDTNYCLQPWLVNVVDDIYAVSYGDSSTSYIVKTLEITAAGAIDAATIDSLVIASSVVTIAAPAYIIHVTGTFYSLAYEGAGNDGFIVLITIESDGEIGDTIDETLEFAPIAGLEPSLIRLNDDVIAIATSGTTSGVIYTISTGFARGYSQAHFIG